ncbi:MAG: Mur ligase domain-containing protein, partial [Bacteroidota bacterium]|nr:Mur ligase domain-containing protein [Bacteroidota bacterium]
MFTAETIASLFPADTHRLSDPSAIIQNVCIDSRKAAWQPDAIFIALQGSRTDGHQYINDAWNQG